MLVPKPRGELSEWLGAALRSGAPEDSLAAAAPDGDGDAHLALWTLYEQHYRGFEDVDVRLEWHPTLLALRRSLEEWFTDLLVERFVPPTGRTRSPTASSPTSPSTTVRPLARSCSGDADRGAGPRAAAGPLALPAARGRPDDVGDPAAAGPGRRWR